MSPLIQETRTVSLVMYSSFNRLISPTGRKLEFQSKGAFYLARPVEGDAKDLESGSTSMTEQFQRNEALKQGQLVDARMHEARADLFYKDGWVLRRSEQRRCSSSGDDVFGDVAAAMLEGKAYSAPMESNGDVNQMFYGMTTRAFMNEHAKRLCHMYLFREFATTCITVPEEARIEAQVNRGFVVCLHEYLKATSLDKGPDSTLATTQALKRTLAFTVAALLTFLPNLRQAIPQPQCKPVGGIY